MRRTRHERWYVTALTAGLVFAPTAAEARPNLAVTKVGKPPSSVVAGEEFRVPDTVANRGSARASRSDTRFYLTTGRRRSLTDILVTGARTVRPLLSGESSAASRQRAARLEVPAGTPAGRYRLLGCADDRHRVRESNEGDNCRAARRRLAVVEPAVADDLRSMAISDVFSQPSLVADEAQLPGMRVTACRPQPTKRHQTLEAALRSVKRSLSQRAGPEAYRAFRRSGHYRNALAAERAAGAAVFFDQPGAALAALIRAHELEPRDASHLANAAALATALGLPSEALAMLDESARLDDDDVAAMGISRQAVQLANRSHAFASLGRYADSARAADAALRIDPQLKEAASSGGVARLCRGRAALPLIRRSRERHPEKEPPLDDSAGVASRLRSLPLPATPEEAVAFSPFYNEQASSGRTASGRDRLERAAALRQRIAARRSPGTPLNAKLLLAVETASNHPPIRALYAELEALGNRMTFDVYGKYWCQGTGCSPSSEYGRFFEQCEHADDFNECMRSLCVPAAKGWHDIWLREQAALYAKHQQAFRALSRRASALAAHIKDPDTHQLALLSIEAAEDGLYFGAHQHAMRWAQTFRSLEMHCVEGGPAPASMEDEKTAIQDPGACPHSLDGFRAVIDFQFAKIKVDCSEVEIGGSLGAGWIKAFGKVDYDFRSGRATVFVGSEGAVRGGPFSADFRSGIYVTASSRGIEDIGWRVGPGVKASAGVAEFRASETIDISFVGAFSGLGN